MQQDHSQAEKRLGRGMLYVGWIVVICLLAFVFSEYEASKQNPNRNLVNSNGDSAEVVLEKSSRGHYLFTGLANGTEIDFLVDTGASSIVFTETQAAEIGLQKGFRTRVSTANGDISVYSTTLRKLQIGSLILYDLPAQINPHMDAEALLGMSALRELEWTQRRDQLILRVPSTD